MSHNLGTVQMVVPALVLGPDSGTLPTSPNRWEVHFTHAPAPGGTKFLILHFTAVSLPAGNRLEVGLGYDTDVFTAVDGADFWTRPIDVTALPGGAVPIRYIADGSASGVATLATYGRGESLPGGANGITNCDPFLQDAAYAEPQYDDQLICGNEPDWQNVDCLPDGDIRREVAASCGMIMMVHGDEVSSCSVTCIGADLILLAGHCFTNLDAEIASASVIFNYAVNCDGSRPAGYQGRFFKVERIIFRQYQLGVADSCIVQLRVPPGGLGVPARPMRSSLPAVGEGIFMIHHPFGAVKKISPAQNANNPVLDVRAEGIFVELDAAVGSSGCALFDLAGQIVGVLSYGFGCSETFYASADLLIALRAEPPLAQDVMIVFDRSGSMALSAGTGRTKMNEARDAASLFIQLLRAESRVGLVSFSTSATQPVDFALADADQAAKDALVGPAPFSGGIVGNLSSGGTTTIGGGLSAALDQFPVQQDNARAILLLTDGLQNTPPLIESVAPQLSGIDVHAIGFGEPQNLDGALLSSLAAERNGVYTRAGDPLDLKKFFAMAFGNIFEAGTLADPRFTLPAGETEAAPWPFPVCDEVRITVVLGWDDADVELGLILVAPDGSKISFKTKGIEAATGRTWTFLRLPIPFGKAGAGEWLAHVYRAGGDEELPVTYFLNVIADGGARLKRVDFQTSYYTGDAINPRVSLLTADGQQVPGGAAALTITRPKNGLGNLLSETGIDEGGEVLGDTLSPRTARLLALAEESEEPLVTETREETELSDAPDAVHLIGPFGIYGRPLDGLLTTEGVYTFHARARYGNKCTATRELIWSVDVVVGIDPATSDASFEKDGEVGDNLIRLIFQFTPRDRFKNSLGPGRADRFQLTGLTGVTVAEPPADLGDGRYRAVLHWNPKQTKQPSVALTQPNRPPVVFSS